MLLGSWRQNVNYMRSLFLLLFNFQFQIHWKLNLIYLLLDAYVSWTQKSHLASISVEHFTKEKLFYYSFGLAFIGEPAAYAHIPTYNLHYIAGFFEVAHASKVVANRNFGLNVINFSVHVSAR